MPYPPGPNTVNFNSCANWGRITPRFHTTTVGSNGGPSYYGTYDQNGNVRELVTELYSNSLGTLPGALGGSAVDNLSNLLVFNAADAPGPFGYSGFRPATSFTSDTLSSFVDILDTNNPSDPIKGYGSVSYSYKISQYTVTYCEYLDFLRAMVRAYGVAGTTPGIEYFDQCRLMISETSPGVFRNDMSEGITVSLDIIADDPNHIPRCFLDIQPNMSNKPVRAFTLDRAIRYCNWLSNGKPGGDFAGLKTTTEDGAYTVPSLGMGLIQPTISIPSRNSINPNNGSSLLYYIPTINEWHKAAYYNGNGNYWTYATQSNDPPSCVISDPNGDGPVVSNYNYSCTAQPSCDKKIIKVYMPGALLFPNGQRATSLHLRIGNNSTTCCSNKSNIIDLTVPAVTPTRTPTPTASVTPTITPTITPTPSITPTNTVTPSITPTNTVTPSITATITPTPSVTKTQGASPTPTKSNTPTPTVTTTITATPSVTPTQTVTKTTTPTITPTKAKSKTCLDPNTNLNGYTVKILYEHLSPNFGGCSSGHVCNRGLFDVFIKNKYIGLMNINNNGGVTDSGPIPGKSQYYRENIYYINEDLIINSGDNLSIVCRNNYTSNVTGRQSNMTVMTPGATVPLAAFDTNTIVKFFSKPSGSNIVLWNKNYYIVNVISNNVIQISDTKNGTPIIFNAGGQYSYITTGQSSLGYPAANCHRGVSRLEIYDTTNNLIVSTCVPDGDTVRISC